MFINSLKIVALCVSFFTDIIFPVVPWVAIYKIMCNEPRAHVA